MGGLSASGAAAKARGPLPRLVGARNVQYLDGSSEYYMHATPLSPFRRAQYSPGEAESGDGKTVALVRAREGARTSLLTLPTPPFMVAKQRRYGPR